MNSVSIVIVNFNTKKVIVNCIKSIQKFTKSVKFEIIVVDNGSTDGSLEILASLDKRGEIKLIENKINLGFGKANNIGSRKAKFDHILFLNSDTILVNDVIGECVEKIIKYKSGIFSCALKNTDGTLQANGGYFPTLSRVFVWMAFIDDLPLMANLLKPFHPNIKSGFYRRRRKLDWVTGAFLLTTKSIFNKVGGFDTEYFMYTEDVDLCYRIKKLDKSVVYDPSSHIIHLGGASSNKEFSIVNEFKGVKIFFRKYMSSWKYFALRIILKMGAMLRIFLGIVKGKEYAKTYIKAFVVA